ncbi:MULTISPECIES: hypothetical protein [Yersinia]|uniref:hypothetical protein n=1 Tax=Yersinia TaxID=629 RepID=UPI000A93C2EC|nr:MULTISPECIES: hypothetical protein [Yersinia]
MENSAQYPRLLLSYRLLLPILAYGYLMNSVITLGKRYRLRRVTHACFSGVYSTDTRHSLHVTQSEGNKDG